MFPEALVNLAGRSDSAQIVMRGECHDVIMIESDAAAEFFGEIDIGRTLIDLRQALPFADALRQAPGTVYATRCPQRGFGIPGYVIHLVPQPLSIYSAI